MNNKTARFKHKKFIIIFLILLFFTPITIAIFTSSKKHDGNVTIKNHPCTIPIGPAAKYILDKEGGIDAIEAKGTPDFNK